MFFANPFASILPRRAQFASRTTPWTIAELESTSSTASAAPASNQTTTATTSTNTGAAKTTATATKNTASGTTKKPVAKAAVKKSSYDDIHQLVQKNTCLTCHNPTSKLIGPSYAEIAKKKYSVAQIVQLIQKPSATNWPGYATRMPPMAHVPKSELTKIAEWIKSLEKAK